MARLTKDQIATKAQRSEREIAVPEWDGDVLVRGLTAQQINQCSRRSEDATRGGEVNTEVRNGWYLVEGVIDPKLTIKDAEAWLTEYAFGPVSTVLHAILEESGLTERSKSDVAAPVQEQS